MRKLFFLFVSTSLLCTSAFGGETPDIDYDQFLPMTFRRFEKRPESKRQKLGEKRINTDLETHPFRINVLYTGFVRSLPSAHKSFLEMFGKATETTDFITRFADEIKVTEGGKGYWVPVQSQTLPYLPKELRPGDAFTIFVRYLGSTGNDRIFVMVEFQSHPKTEITRR